MRVHLSLVFDRRDMLKQAQNREEFTLKRREIRSLRADGDIKVCVDVVNPSADLTQIKVSFCRCSSLRSRR